MERRGLDRVVDTLRRVTAEPDCVTDAELLERFLAERDEVAFDGLLRRHGPMVLGVCRRILGHVQDAEDAFQATFLILVRKAASIAPREQVGNWLYGVAQQTARKARTARSRRDRREQAVAKPPDASWAPTGLDADVAPLLDREISCLPPIYRAVLVQCDLEGKSRKEAAAVLGWREGTVAGRLARARKLLADRLARRGITSPAVLAPLVVPPALTSSTLVAATAVASGEALASAAGVTVAALAEGVLPTMSYLPFKMVAALVVVAGLFGAAVGAGTRFGVAPGPQQPAPAPVAPAPAAERAQYDEAARLYFAALTRRSQKEDAIARKLAQPVSVKFKDVPLFTVLHDIRMAHGLHFWIDSPALEAARISTNRPVTFQAEQVSLGKVLQGLLGECGLTAIVKDEVIQITTPGTTRSAQLTAEQLAERIADLDIQTVLNLRDEKDTPPSRPLTAEEVAYYLQFLQQDPKPASEAAQLLLRKALKQLALQVEKDQDAAELRRQAERALAQLAYAEQLAAARRLLAQHQAVVDVVAALEKAIQGVRAAGSDKQTEIDTLDAIIKAAQEMKARAEKGAGPKKP
jgi:RNA polymerase sigma factor (sigma-70 family)